MGLIEAGSKVRLDPFVGYCKPHATSHQQLAIDRAFQEEVRNVARGGGNRQGRARRHAAFDRCQSDEHASEVKLHPEQPATA